MKRTAIALGLSLAAADALAESRVTLYGIVDVGIEYQNNQVKHAGSVLRMTSGNISGSRWGLLGNEDLGGGTSAVFDLENGFDTTNGTLGFNGREFGRQAYVGLSNDRFGTLLFGRQNGVMFDFAALTDPLVTYGKYSITAMDSAMSQRSDNAVKYTFHYGALSAVGFYSFGADSTVTGGAQVPGESWIGREVGASLSYGKGPLFAGVAYDELNTGTVTLNPHAHFRRIMAAANYVFGPTKTFVGYRYGKAFNGAILPGAAAGQANQQSNLYFTGVKWTASPALFITGAVYYQDFRNTSGDPLLFSMLVNYFMSKRTSLYLSAAYAKNHSNSQLGVSGFGKTDLGYDQTGVVAGITTRF